MSLKLYEQESHLPVVSRSICRFTVSRTEIYSMLLINLFY